MKRKILILMALVVAIVCMLAISVSAAEPNNEGKTVTLADGTVCALYDTDGNPLIWYIASTDADTGAKTYAYIAANDSAVDYYNGWNGGDQLNSIKITVDETTYEKGTFVVLNLYGAKITSGQRIGNEITYFSQTFTSATNLEYAFLPLGTTALSKEDFKSCSNLQFVNIEELTELTRIGSQSFNGCPKLFAGKKVDLSNTKLVSTDTNALATVAATEYIFPATFTTIGQETFKENKYVTKITFLGEVTTVANGAYATFKYCENLETVTGTAKAFESGNLTSINKEAFRGCKKLKQFDGIIENGILTIPEGVATVAEFAFTECDLITYIDFPSTLTKINQQGFSYMSNVKLMDFGKVTGVLTLGNCGHFRDMDSLVAVCLPEGMVEINNRAFASCDNLTAVYMPNSVQRLSSNGSGQGSFCESKKMYFVQDRFTVDQCLVNGEVDLSKLVLPEKPTIYYMPTSLQTFTGHIYSNDTWSNATIFQNCTAINDVLVFPESFTKMVTMKVFNSMGTESSPKTIIFTGDMEQMVLPHQSKYISYVFANANDKSFEDLGFVRTTGNSNEKGSYAYFCSTGKKYDLAVSGRQGSGQDPTTEENITKIAETITALKETETNGTLHTYDKNNSNITPATCIKNAYGTLKCFCGYEMGTQEIANTATGIHIYDDDHDCTTSDKCTADPDCTEVTAILSHELYETLVYESFLAGGKYNYGCSNDGCTVIDIVDEDAKAIFSAGADKGYSTNGDGIAFGGYTINIDALNEYNRVNENNKLNFGIIIVNPNYVGDTFMKDGMANAEKGFLQVDMSDAEYSNIQIMVNGFAGNAKDLSLVFTLYAYTDANDVEFIQSEDTLSASAKVTKTDATLYTVTLDSVKAQAGTAIPELPEYVVPSKEQE